MEHLAATSRAVARQFALGNRVISVAPLGGGHIHETYVVVAASGTLRRRYILQRINRWVFPDPVAVVRNIEHVTKHILAKLCAEGGDVEREVLALIPTRRENSCFRDDEGEVWRCYAMIEGASVQSALADADQVRAAAGAFGRFLRQLSDFPANVLIEPIHGFHDAARHMTALQAAVRSDPADRAHEVLGELQFIEECRPVIETWMDLLTSGTLPTRVTHNDTKVDNILIDERSGRGICVLDLDTVMPGSALIVIGDCARSALTGNEDAGMAVDTMRFAAVLQGYLEEAGDLLSDAEIANIVLATRAIALELGIRFLTDHIEGDRWFPVESSSQNLLRCRVQLHLARCLGENEERMLAIVRHMVSRFRG